MLKESMDFKTFCSTIRRIELNYKVDPTEATDLLIRKDQGICECCGKQDVPWSKMHIDHNHKTGKVRGVVCASCNSKIGVMETKTKNYNLYSLAHLDWITYRGY